MPSFRRRRPGWCNCPPESTILTDLALTAARWVVMPTKSDVGGLVGMRLVGERFALARELNPELEDYRVPRAPGAVKLPKDLPAPTDPTDLTSATAHAAAPFGQFFERHHPCLNAWETSGSAADRGVFLTEVWGPVLKRFKLTRHDLPKPQRVRAALAQEQRAE